MPVIPAKVKDRLTAGLKRFQPILVSAKDRDINEADTVTIVKDVLAEIFGFDKYAEITAEFAIRGTYVDLALRIDGKLQTLVEVKAIGLDLKEAFIKQAVDYGVNQGIEWVILTNGVQWNVYKIAFSKPVEAELTLQLNILALNPKNQADLDNLYLITREGLGKSMLGDYHAQRQALSRFFIGAVVLSDPILDVIRRELRRISPDVKIDTDQIKSVLEQEVFKRDVLEGEKADEARRKINRIAARNARAKSSKEGEKDTPAPEEPAPIASPEPPPPTP